MLATELYVLLGCAGILLSDKAEYKVLCTIMVMYCVSIWLFSSAAPDSLVVNATVRVVIQVTLLAVALCVLEEGKLHLILLAGTLSFLNDLLFLSACLTSDLELLSFCILISPWVFEPLIAVICIPNLTTGKGAVMTSIFLMVYTHTFLGGL